MLCASERDKDSCSVSLPCNSYIIRKRNFMRCCRGSEANH